MRDWRGEPLDKGSIVIYPQRQGSHLWMVEATVVSIGECYREGRVVPSLTVLPISTTWTHSAPVQKEVTLTALDRVTVIRPRPQDTLLPELSNAYCSLCHGRHEGDDHEGTL